MADAERPTAIGGGPTGPSTAEAIGVLAAKRCERAVRCGRVGPGKAFPDEDQCRTAARLALESQRYVQRCAARIDARALEACAEAIAAAPCAGAGDRDLADVAECQLRNLCVGER